MIITTDNIEHIKDTNKKIVLTGGCFDVLHEGHKEFLGKSKQTGEILIILLESDQNVTERKGKNRPINTQQERANQLELLKIADYIVLLPYINTDNYYYNLVLSLRPAIIAVTKGDPLIEIKRDQARRVNGKVIEVMSRNEAHSSTDIINKKNL